jgi:hypothetical protein
MAPRNPNDARQGMRPRQQRDAPSGPSRSVDVTLWVLGGLFIGYGIVRDLTADPVARNVYRSEAACRCDYGSRCQWSGGQWVGPWYAQRPEDRQSEDPGAGGQCTAGSGGGRTGGGYNTRDPDSGPTRDNGIARIEDGYRGGFGSTGSVRSAKA